MNKHTLQRDIQIKSDRDNLQTNRWIKSQGLSADVFAKMDMILLQAQQIAHNCLKHYGRFLGPNEAAVLNTFLKALTNQARRRRITQAQIHKVMNIGSQVNRKAFKQLRHLEKQAKTKAS